MYARIHDHREIYTKALEQLENVETPKNHGERVRIRVKYDMEHQEVIYTLTFHAIFNADFEPGKPKFNQWSYDDRLDEMSVNKY